MSKLLRRENPLFVTSAYTLSLVYAVLILVPIYFVFIAAFKDNAQIFLAPLSLPHVFTFENFRAAFAAANLFKAFGFSVYVTVGAELLVLLLAFPAAFAIGRTKTRLASWMEGFFALGFLVPILPLLLTTYLFAAKIGMLNNPLMLILFYPAARLPFCIMFLGSFVRGVPYNLEESAEIDGASRWKIMLHIFIPLTMPGLVNVIILNFMEFWNEYLFALTMLNTQTRTLQVALAALALDVNTIKYGHIAAGTVLATIPVFIVFFIFQKRIMSNILSGAVKG